MCAVPCDSLIFSGFADSSLTESGLVEREKRRGSPFQEESLIYLLRLEVSV